MGCSFQFEDIQKFPTAEFHKEICLATQVRQEAVAKQADVADLTIVVGDPKSNNSNRLEVHKKSRVPKHIELLM